MKRGREGKSWSAEQEFDFLLLVMITDYVNRLNQSFESRKGLKKSSRLKN